MYNVGGEQIPMWIFENVFLIFNFVRFIYSV